MEEYTNLVKAIRNIGIEKGMTVIIHSSFKALGLSNITPRMLIQAFQEVITEEGNLLIPTLSYKTVNKDNPIFSYHDTPSCVGVVSETFRKMDNVYRSLNPIHSIAAWGENAIELTSNHIKDNITLWYNSPLYLMLKYNAKILMLGCTLLPNTFMHLVENLNHLPYREIKRKIPMTIYDKNYQVINHEVHLPDMSMYEQCYDRVSKILDEEELKISHLNQATTYLIDANSLLKKASEILKTNPYYFVEEIKH